MTRATSSSEKAIGAKQRRPGRPSSAERSEDVRKKLIATSQRLFAEKGFGEVGLREIGRAAGVTPAMISYYFGDKAGLYEAVFVDTLDTLLSRIKAVAATVGPGQMQLEHFLETYFKTIVERPWLPQLLLREVVSRDTPLRKLFIDRFAGQATTLLPALIQQQVRDGQIRSDLDPRHILLSLLGMTVFPVIAAPVLGPLLGYRLDERFAAERTEQIHKLFLEGAAPRDTLPSGEETKP